MSDTAFVRETPDVHDAFAGKPAAEPGERALPTPTSPGYTYFTDYRGRRWTCCTCMKEFLELAQRVAIKRGLLKQGFDIWQLTGGATASAGTHSQGGAFDLLYQTTAAWAKFFRDLGATATWVRYKSQGFTADHLHGVLNGCVHNTPARYQVTEQKSGPPAGGGDGLTGTKPDYHPDPVVYRTWQQGVELMKKELGLLAVATATTLTIDVTAGFYPQDKSTLSASTGTAVGSHVYEFLSNGVWKQFAVNGTTGGKSTRVHAFGGTHPVRVRFVPTDPAKYKPSTSNSINVSFTRAETMFKKVVELEALVKKQSLEITGLKAQIEGK